MSVDITEARPALDVDMPIDDAVNLLGLSTRWRNAIASENDCEAQRITTLRDLLRRTERELRRMHNIAHRSIDELRAALARHNLFIGQCAADQEQQG